MKTACTELKEYLEDKIIFVNDRLTLADIIMFTNLHKELISLITCSTFHMYFQNYRFYYFIVPCCIYNNKKQYK